VSASKQPNQPGIDLFTLHGVPIRLHWSIFPVFGLLAYSLATNVFRKELRPGETDYAWLLGLGTSALFLASIVLHEMGHAIVAQRNKIPVNSITLYFFGGIAAAADEPRKPGIEFRVAGAGPLVTALLSIGFFLISRIDALPHMLSSAFWWLAGINLALLVFNLIPGYPLDGGRIFHSIIWATTKSETRATRYAVRGGQAVAALLFLYGMYQIAVTGNIFNGLWSMMLAAFLRNAATSTGAYVLTRSILERATAAQTMARNIVYLGPRTRVEEVLEHQPAMNVSQAYVVVEDGPLGVFSPIQLAFVPRERRPWTVVSQIMTPWRQVIEIQPDASLMSVLKDMEQANTTYGVIRQPDGMVMGILTRDQIAVRLQHESQRA